jgi:rare lipoprotein A
MPSTAAVNTVVAALPDAPKGGVDAGVMVTTQSPTSTPGVDLGTAAAVDAVAAMPGSVTTVSESVATTSLATPAVMPARAEKPDERTRADTTAGIGWWIQLGAFKQRDGALDFQRRLIDEQPWLGPLLAVFSDRGLNKLQAGPYTSRDDARSAAEKIRSALQLVPTIVEKR